MEHFTSIEQSNELLELGLPAESADCYYGKDGKIHIIDGSIPKSLIYCVNCTPCWTTGRMIEILEQVVGKPWQDSETMPKTTLMERVLICFRGLKKLGYDFNKLED